VAHREVLGLSAMSRAKMAEPIEMPFRVRTRVAPCKHALDRGHIGTTWRMRLSRPYVVAMCQVMSGITAGTDDGKLFHFHGPAPWNAQLYTRLLLVLQSP